MIWTDALFNKRGAAAADPMMAKIGFMKALHRDVVREFKSDCKETHWGKLKLKRHE